MNNKKIFVIVLIVIALILATYMIIKNNANNPSKENPPLMENSSEQNEAAYIDITPTEAKKLIQDIPETIIIDVSPHYAKGHLPGAINYYIGDGSLDNVIPKLNKDKTYLVYCHVDSASISGAQKLIDAGFKKVYRLEGNYSAWVETGYEIEK